MLEAAEKIEQYTDGMSHAEFVSDEKTVDAVLRYGSVARGDADNESDIDILVITDDDTIEDIIEENWGTLRIDTSGQDTKLCLTESCTMEDFRTSLAHGSQFLENILSELHPIYDPERLLTSPEETMRKLSRDGLSQKG